MDLPSTVLPAMAQAALPKPTADILTTAAPPIDFVVPTVTVRGSGFDPHKPILLISAPGAVGKSALAHYIAGRCDTMIWDLSRLVVGDNTFLGTVAKTFGTAQLTSVLNAFQTGTAPFVFDALDEADILSGWPRLERFVLEVAEQTAQSRRPCAVMLARSETIGLLDLALSSVGENPIHQVLEIDYFDQRRSHELVTKLVARSKGTEALLGSVPLERAISCVFDALAKAMSLSSTTVWDSREGKGFLGYAPVLQAIAAFLSGFDNLATFSEDSLQGGNAGADGGLATIILSKLLQREHQKFTGALTAKQLPGSGGYNGWDDLYLPQEQVERLLAYCDTDKSATAPAKGLPPWLAKDYAEALASFLPNHPFVANRGFAGPAFRDFTIASGLRAAPSNPRAERRAADASFLPTPLLSSFYCDLSKEPGSGAHVGILYESATGAAGLDDEATTTFVGPDTDSDLHILNIGVSGREDATGSGLEIRIAVNDVSPVVLRRRLRNAAIETPGRVILGQAGGAFEIGNSDIACGGLEIAAREVQFRVADEQDYVTLVASDLKVHATPPVVSRYGTGTVRLTWPGVEAYPWTAYAWDPKVEPAENLHSKLSALRSILRWFRRDKRNEFAKHREHIDNNVVKDRPTRELVLRALLKESVLTEDGYLYVLHPDRASKLGIDWVNVVTHGRMSPQLQAFLERI